jgi:transposase-like protein
LVCPACGSRMSLTRRGPHLDKVRDHEAQTFHCGKCGHEIRRDVGKDGKPLGYPV